jgi:hypothetical protein
MGICSDGKVYGVSFRYTDITIFERKYEGNVSASQIQEIKDFYDELSEDGRKSMSIFLYMSFKSSYCTSDKPLMSWVPSTRDRLETLF